ncbi:aldehyde dehydrogenase family protein [Bradyrhizobium sp. 2TAF24]|uniref:aldehyde dehydrogenase family protein n=1 Tax=Bradyrhizobium sp. 2TAF24 TaxID=3233011 RepID=UPI003F902794
MERYALVIDGKTVQAADHFEVLNPSTGAVAGLAPKASREQLDDAIEAAARAQKAWAKRPDAERKQLCHAVADKIKDNAEELARLLTIEQGKPLNGLGSRFELGGAQAWAHYTADLDIPVKVLQDNNEGRIELHRKPVGVVGSITPWNWPLMIAIWHIIPAIRAGNTVVNKPSPFTPLSTLRMIELMQEVLPPGVVSCVAGEDFLGAHMSGHQGIGKITFTGSSATGQKVMSSASNTLKRLTLELGGNDAGIVLPDVDPQQVAEGLFWGAFINNGQTCAALKRLYVHDNVYDEICNSLVTYAKNIPVGDGLDEKSVLGPIQNRMQRDKVARLVEAAKTAGGKVLLGGTADKEDSLFFPLTLISDLDNGNPLVDEEQFGPALPIIRYSNIDEVIARANDNPNGLGGSVWSKDTAKAKDIALQLECGSAWINKHGAIQPNAPFGGVKGSGVGVEFGEEGLFENTDVQVIHS